MIMKTDTKGNVTLTYDGSSNLTVDNSISSNCATGYAWSSAVTTDSVKSLIEEMNRKPEVRVDQRSSLKVGSRTVEAYYYKDGFRTTSKDLIPVIKSIEVFNENTIKMTFVNGDVQTVTVRGDDPYFFEDGLLRCITKEMIGKEGTAILSKLLSYATKVYEDAEADKKKKAEEEAKKKAKAEKNYKKAKKYWEKKRAIERENRIQEMAEAIVRAKEMKKNV